VAERPSREARRQTHPCATTTPKMRRAIQASDEKNVDLAKRFGANRKTISKWKWRDSVSDEPMGPKNPRPRLLSLSEDAMILAYRWRTRLSLDDCHTRLKRIMPKLTRTTLSRCLVRYGLSQIHGTAVPPALTPSALTGPFTFEIIACEVVFAGENPERRQMFLAVEEITKDVFAQLTLPTPDNAAAFIASLVAEFPQKIIRVTTNISEIFTSWRAWPFEEAPIDDHPFAEACSANNILHTRTIAPNPKPPKIRSSVVIREQYYTADQWARGIPV
jgi:hypothetical protein